MCRRTFGARWTPSSSSTVRKTPSLRHFPMKLGRFCQDRLGTNAKDNSPKWRSCAGSLFGFAPPMPEDHVDLPMGEKVTVPVASLVQEHGLEWAREMRGGTGCELILSAASHIALMQHNYSNVAK